MEKKKTFAILEENHLDGERAKFYVELYETEELAKKKMKEQIEECIEQNHADIVDGDLESDYVEVADSENNLYIFELSKEYIRGE